jgi:hypothetical protein
MKTRTRATLLPAASSALLALISYAYSDTFAAESGRGTQSLADSQGNLRVPEGYRSTYEYLGTWAIAAAQGQGSKELHVVYASPGTIGAYQKEGKFPDGATLVKEVFEAATAPMTTGTVSHANKLKGWFVMIRDTSNDHPGNKLWGDGWGWAWFDANSPLRTTSRDYRIDCLTCHIPARTSDWIYVGGYPSLSR